MNPNITKILIELLPVILPILLDCFDNRPERQIAFFRMCENKTTAEAMLKIACEMCICHCEDDGCKCPDCVCELYKQLGGKVNENDGVISIVV